MVKLSGPLHSIEASGSLAGSITFNKSRTGATLRKKPQPKHPQTPTQQAIQAILRFVTRQWSTLTPNEQTSWVAADPNPRISAYSKYVAFNTARSRNLLGPTKAYPPALTGDYCERLQWWTEGKVRHIDHHYRNVLPLNQNWGICLFTKLTDDPSFSIEYLTELLIADDFQHHYWTQTPMNAASYRIRLHRFTTDGQLETTDHLGRRITVY